MKPGEIPAVSSSTSETKSALQLPCPPGEVDDFLSEPTEGVLETLKATPGPIAVLGAGGKLGLHFAAMIQKGLGRLGRRERLIAVSRFSSLRDQGAFSARGIETIACDLADATAVAALPDAPTVIFLAGVKFGTSNAPELLHQMNVVMPRIVAERFASSRIIAFSTGCVYPFVAPHTGGATEETPAAPPGAYAKSCLAREEAFSAVSRDRGTPVVLLRLNYAVEFRYGVLLDIAQKVEAGQPVDVTMGHVNVIWQRDAVAHSLQALALASSPAVPLNVTGPEIVSVRELATLFGQRLGRSPIIVGQESPTAWLNNASFAHQRFGRPSTSLAVMIDWVAAWVRQAGQTWGKPTGFEKRDGKF